ncbi:MAG TPA: sensor histidine kinase KdpD [Bryobacteraceae bacterium]|nr:sensor histidine kinase KdpD [Bryobacteraceae bacterium]
MNGSHKGRLKVYLGYAAGVGKTYQMLVDAHELRRKGVDVVIAYFEPHGRQDTIAKSEGLERVPARILEYGGARFDEMDTGAVLRRKPAVAVVDEFAHTNVPGSEREKRWQDVHVLLDAGIDVLTTVNVQHLESLNDHIRAVTGVRVRETVPDWVIADADEVVLVDLTPRALRNRLERGVVYSPDKARQALENFFTESNLSALRELALRQAAHEVEEKISKPAGIASAAGAGERVLICLTGSPSSAILIRRGKRVADYLQADCLAVHVMVQGRPEADAAVEQQLRFARNLRIETRLAEGHDVPRTIAEVAHQERVTQIFLGRSEHRPKWNWLGETIVQQVVRLARDVQITVVARRNQRLT